MPVFLRLTAALLAATGLLGHGIAMLLVGLLAAPGAADAQARDFSDICTPNGLVRLADIAPRDSDDDGEKPGDPLKSCPVCTTYAQIGAADLPAALAAAAAQCCSATQGMGQGSSARSTISAKVQPRAPPAIA